MNTDEFSNAQNDEASTLTGFEMPDYRSVRIY